MGVRPRFLVRGYLHGGDCLETNTSGPVNATNSSNRSMSQRPHGEMRPACLPRHPAVAYLRPALGIVDHLRCRFARFKLGAHLLKAGYERFDLLFLFRELGLKA